MNNPNSLPPPPTLEQQTRVKSNIRIAVVTILAIHVVLFGGLLMQGCKRDDNRQAVVEPTNALPPFDPNAFTNPAPELTPAPPNLNATAQPPPPAPAVPAPAQAMSEYVVVKGDSFATIAKSHGTTIKAIAAANPGVDSTRLKIGQKLQLPPPIPTAMSAAAPPTEPGAAPEMYAVKSGDSLSSIAKKYGTTVKALRTLNNLTSDMIKVGQKLKLPAPPAPAPTPAPPPAAGQ